MAEPKTPFSGHLGPPDKWLGVAIKKDVVHSGCYQIPKATVIYRHHGTTEQMLECCEMWVEHRQEYLQEKNGRGLWRVVMNRHDYLEELFNPLGHEVEDERDAVS